MSSRWTSAHSFLGHYVNFALTNGAVTTARFDDRDRCRECRQTLRDAFSGREVVQLNVDRRHRGWGGIHCVTKQEPAQGHRWSKQTPIRVDF
ncbi:MAG: agmatine deiminase family protein [Actinomycetia bacterium]|nr:agmatine deiminase family protein [Actinomycetes bacterium]